MDRNDFFTNPKGRIQMKKWIPQLAALTLAVGAVAADPLPAEAVRTLAPGEFYAYAPQAGRNVLTDSVDYALFVGG